MEQNSDTCRSSDTEGSANPNQEVIMSEEANRHVRDTYRDLMVDFHDQTVAGEEVVTLENIHAMVRRANDAFNQVKRPQEAVMDAQLLKTCGTLAKLNIESSQTNSRVFKPNEFARKLMNFADPDDDMEGQDRPEAERVGHLVRFGNAVSGLYKSVVGLEPMYSAIEWERPSMSVQRVRNRNKDDNDSGVLTKPTEISLSSQEEEAETEIVSRMYKVLKQRYQEAGNTPLCFFTFVVDPSSYSRTVENMFNTSLLVREQCAEITEDDNGIPVIAPLSQGHPQVGGKSNQCVIGLSHREWKEIVKVFEITSPMIPHPSKRKTV